MSSGFKYMLSFASGCVIGAFGAMVYLHRAYKAKCEEGAFSCVSEHSGASDEQKLDDSEEDGHKSDNKGNDVPFSVGSGINTNKGVDLNTSKMRYDSLVREYQAEKEDVERARTELAQEAMDEDTILDEEEKKTEAFYEALKNCAPFEEISDLGDWNDSDFTQVRYVYFRGDSILCTEDGSIVHNPEDIVGSQWKNWIGKVYKNTAMIRDNRRALSIEIAVEDGLYSDEYGDFMS